MCMSLSKRYDSGKGIMHQVLDTAVAARLDPKTLTKIVKILIENRVNIASKDANGNTVLHYASKYDLPSVIEILINNGAKGSIQNDQGFTPFDIAKTIGLSDQDLLWRLNDLKFE